MSNPRATGIKDDDVPALTDKGDAELKSAGTSLSAEELELLVLIDGKATVAQLRAAAGKLAIADVAQVLMKLFAGRLITNATEPSSDGLESGFFSIDVPAGFFSATTSNEHSEAEHGVSSLTRNGYYVRIARRPAAHREAKEGQKFTVLVVDDDPDLAKLLKTYLSLEGFVPRLAANAAEIVRAFRQAPLPDLVLLDVGLPDANGFNVLAKMRQHPVLKAVPVIMLTAEATREAVLKGLRAGADGYVTKPFEPDALTTAVKSVLGLGPVPHAPTKK
jgi:two-component system, OmpR family, response regulator